MKNTKVIQNINKNDRGESGITLISLIITVIVLIILLGVTELVIPNGLFSKARGGKEGIDEAIGTGQDTVNEIKKTVPEETVNEVALESNSNGPTFFL